MDVSAKFKQGVWVLIVCALASCASFTAQDGDFSALTEARLQLGLEYLKQGELSLSHQNLKSALELAPQDYRTQLSMALYCQVVEDNRAAEHYYHQALKLSPKNGAIMNNYGAFLCGLGQYIAAQEQFAAAMRIYASDKIDDVRENAGYCYLRSGDNETARTLLTRILQNDPNRGEQLLMRAEEEFSKGNRAQAQFLLGIYQDKLPANASSLWLQIRFAALAGHQDSVQYYGRQLAQSFPQSKQYQQFLTHEY